MPDFYAPTQRSPLVDQADGLRRLFGGRRTRLLPVVANPFVLHSTTVLDRLANLLADLGCPVLVVDASDTAPLARELTRVDLAACIESIGPDISYLAARGLPLDYVDTRGCAGALIDALQQACPQADVILLHAEASDLVRVLKRVEARPLLLATDDADSLKQAYASCKLLVQRCGLMTYDLLLAAATESPRVCNIASSLASCADQFLSAVVQHAALADPCRDPRLPPSSDLLKLLQAQVGLPLGTSVEAEAEDEAEFADRAYQAQAVPTFEDEVFDGPAMEGGAADHRVFAVTSDDAAYETLYDTPYDTPYETPYETPYDTPYETPYDTPYETPYDTPYLGADLPLQDWPQQVWASTGTHPTSPAFR